jgi:CRP-like cAMP-binding protein
VVIPLHVQLVVRVPISPLPWLEILFRQEEPPTGIFIVTKGAAILTMQSGKLIAMQVRAGAGSILGLPGVLGSAPYTLTARALEGAEVDFLPKEEFHCLMGIEPLLCLEILLAAEVRVARQALANP